MKKSKQILAIIGVILLVALYLSTLVLALLGKEFFSVFMAAFAVSIALPVILWLFTLMQKSKKENDEQKNS